MDNTSEIYGRISNNLKELSKFTSTPEKGVTRLPFSDEARQATEYLKKIMSETGLEVFTDCVGNVHGRFNSQDKDAKTIIIGSHYDSVKFGGMYDGIAGVICGLEIIRILKKKFNNPKYNIELIAFNDEEGLMFGSGCLGSKMIMGLIDEKYICHMTDENGITIYEWMKHWGSDIKKIYNEKYDTHKIKLFSEIHIEQGPVLDKEKLELGVVDSIVGLLRVMVTINGRADHAGTTPMNMRKDAIMVACKVISQLDRIVKEENNESVGTCGFIRGYPNAMNIVSESVEFTLDIRSKYQESIDNIRSKLWSLIDKYTQENDMTYNIDIKLEQKPVYMNAELVDRVEKNCRDMGYRYKVLGSGAAHDAMIFAQTVPTIMLFVPSKDGASHSVKESSDINDLVKSVLVMEKSLEDIIMK